LTSFTEADPQVDQTTSGKWCVGTGTAVTCTQNAPVLTETDPVWTSASSNYHTKTQADAAYVNEGQGNSVTSAMITDGIVGTSDINSAHVQRRVSSTCAAGSSISAIALDGTVTCETDDSYMYSAGTGLVLVGTQFRFDNAYKVPNATFADSAASAATAGSAPMIIGGGAASDLYTSATAYLPMFMNTYSATESEVQQAMPTAGTISNFYVRLTGSPGTGNNYIFTVRKNGSSTTVTCTVSDSTTSCTDTGHSVSFVAGDTIDIMSVPNSNPTGQGMHWTAKYQ
jgi:hypothetical protein